MKREPRSHFNMTLTASDRTMLEFLAHSNDMSQGQWLRRAIALAFAMATQHQPYCVSGRHCLVPHLHHDITPPTLPAQSQIPT